MEHESIQLQVKMGRPSEEVGICLVPEPGSHYEGPLDTFVVSSPPWNDLTIVTTASEIQAGMQKAWRTWKAAVDYFRAAVMGETKQDTPLKYFTCATTTRSKSW